MIFKRMWTLVTVLLFTHVVICSQNQLTRGIGIYPGRYSECFAPTLVNHAKYRNVAFRRAAYASSSYDYNLTAQLLTDGVKISSEPVYLKVSTPHGPLPRREREWSIDGGDYTRNVLMGEHTWLQYDWNSMAIHADKVELKVRVAYEDSIADKGYQFCFLVSKNGKKWKTVGIVSGNGLPGKLSRYKVHSDPNKVTDKELLPLRFVDVPLKIPTTPFSHFKIVMKMFGAVHWTVTNVNFYRDGNLVNVLPSQKFSSAWKSAGSGKEWAYVDFGGEASFSEVRLHWIEKAIKGKIQSSDDLLRWKDVAKLPGGQSMTDVIPCSGKARYLRILMEEPKNKELGYVLSEMEVMGKGGMVPVAHVRQDALSDFLSLNGGAWKLQRESFIRNPSAKKISDENYDDSTWLVATVPATALMSYVNAGALPNPNYSNNLFQISESFFCSPFWYRTTFSLPRNWKGKRVFLNVDGINWKACFFLNGVPVQNMAGAFVRGKQDVTKFLKEGENVLAVRVEQNAHPGAVKEKTLENTDFNGGILGADNPTFHATIGWDWISTVRGRDLGIWNDVFLTAKDDVLLEDPVVTTHLNKTDTLATLTPSVFVVNVSDRNLQVNLVGKIGVIKFSRLISLKAGERKEVVFSPDEFQQLKGRKIALWWPNGYGSPFLHDASYSVYVGNRCEDSIHYKAGIREVTYSGVDRQLRIYINGKRFIPMGGNWGFSESNLNYRNREYDVAVKYHKDMHFNMIRNWVGQTGDEEFYEACDRYGIMVWQDFWLANPSDGPDPYDDEMFMDNACDYLCKIRRHPSIALYCGRNEGYPPKTLDEKLRTAVDRLHPGLLFISSSADEGVSGHGPYWAVPPKDYFALNTGKLHTERGMPNIMTFEGLSRTLPANELWPQNVLWGQHDFTMEGAQRGASFNEMLRRKFGQIEGARSFTELSQWINYDGYRAMYESGSKERLGMLIWMSHPCWPSMVWQTYDYYLEPTAAYFGAKKACEPIHIQWNALTRNVEVVDLAAGKYENLHASADVYDLWGNLLSHQDTLLFVDSDSTVVCMKLGIPSIDDDTYYIKLELRDVHGGLLSNNFYVESTHGGSNLSLWKLPRTNVRIQEERTKSDEGWNVRVKISNTGEVPALMLHLNLKGTDGEQILPVFYEDNYFSLLPGENKIINVNCRLEDCRGVMPQVRLSGFNVFVKK